MRELEIVEEILEELRQINSSEDSKISKVKLLIGELNRPKEVEKWLKKTNEKEFQSIEFEIMESKTRVSCKCGYSGKIESIATFPTKENMLEITCPQCGNHNLKVKSGLEKEILNVELEKMVDE